MLSRLQALAESKNSSSLRGLNAEDLKVLSELFVLAQYEAGETIFHLGQAASNVGILLQGTMVLKDSDSNVRASREAGDWIGEVDFVLQNRYGLSSEAVQTAKGPGEIEIAFLSRDRFTSVETGNAALYIKLMNILGQAACTKLAGAEPKAGDSSAASAEMQGEEVLFRERRHALQDEADKIVARASEDPAEDEAEANVQMLRRILQTTRAQVSEQVQLRTELKLRLSDAERQAKASEKLERKLLLAESKISRLEQQLALEQKMRLRATQQLEIKRLHLDTHAAENAELQLKLEKYDEDREGDENPAAETGQGRKRQGEATPAQREQRAGPSLPILRMQNAAARLTAAKKTTFLTVAKAQVLESTVNAVDQRCSSLWPVWLWHM